MIIEPKWTVRYYAYRKCIGCWSLNVRVRGGDFWNLFSDTASWAILATLHGELKFELTRLLVAVQVAVIKPSRYTKSIERQHWRHCEVIQQSFEIFLYFTTFFRYARASWRTGSYAPLLFSPSPSRLHIFLFTRPPAVPVCLQAIQGSEFEARSHTLGRVAFVLAAERNKCPGGWGLPCL